MDRLQPDRNSSSDSRGESSGGLNTSYVPTLEALDVSQVMLLTARSLLVLSSGASAKTLKSLVLDGCQRIDTSSYELSMSRDIVVEEDWTSDESDEDEGVTKTKESGVENNKHCTSCLCLYLPALTTLSAKGLSGVMPDQWAEILAGPCMTELGQLPPLGRLVSLKLGECCLNPSVVAQLLPFQQGSSSVAANADSGSAGSTVETDSSEQRYPFGRHTPGFEATLTELDLSWAAESLSGSDALAFACAAGRSLQTLKLRCVNLEEVEDSTSSSSIGNGGVRESREEDQALSGDLQTEDVAGANLASVLALLGQYCPNLMHLNVSISARTKFSFFHLLQSQVSLLRINFQDFPQVPPLNCFVLSCASKHEGEPLRR